ncbi:MAG: hypothetical protein ACI843_002446 [Psychrobacter glaciei]|jgi:hypothetical protein
MFKDSFVLIVLFCMVLGANSSQARDYSLDLQSGALMGLVHASIGTAFWQRHNFSVGIGYVPKLDNHAEMALYSLRYRYQHPKSWQFEWPAGNTFSVLPFNVGITYLWGDDENLYFDLPDKYPDDYYAATGKRLVFNYQPIIRLSPELEFYIDFSVLDVGLIGYIREPDFYYDNYDFLGLDGITTWGFGMRYQF